MGPGRAGPKTEEVGYGARAGRPGPGPRGDQRFSASNPPLVTEPLIRVAQPAAR